MNDIIASIQWTADSGGVLSSGTPSRRFWDGWRNGEQGAIRAAGMKLTKEDGQWVVWIRTEATLTRAVAESSARRIDATPAPKSTVAWSPEQLAIFEWFKSGSGNLVVQARAGTGKTTTIKEAFSHAPEARMLYAVFNKKNQREAEGKITDQRVAVKTLHSVGYQFVKDCWGNVGADSDVEVVRIQAVSPEIPDEPAGAIKRLVGFAKNTFCGVPSVEELIDLADFRGIFSSEEDRGWTVKRLAEVTRDVLVLSLDEESNPGKISFDDMVWLPVALNIVRPRFDLVVVDEAQDMNAPQLEMAVRAVRKGGRVAIVGDDRQAIYGFRGAASDGMGMMRERLQAATLGLTTTYRCPRAVVALAAEIVPDYNAAPSAPEGVVGDIAIELLTSQVQVGDAILSRTNAPLMGTCLELLRNGTPARIEGRDIGAQLVNMVKKLKATSVPNFIEKLHKWGDKTKARVGKGKNPEQKIAQVEDQVLTLAAVAEGAKNVAEIETRILRLFQDTDATSKPAVVLSTVHKAKGLEWGRVFMLSATFKKERGQEEANIYYVAVTRAKATLTLVR